MSPSRKRKISSNEESPLEKRSTKKKMTAKEKRELLERAQEWAMGDAEAKGIPAAKKPRLTPKKTKKPPGNSTPLPAQSEKSSIDSSSQKKPSIPTKTFTADSSSRRKSAPPKPNLTKEETKQRTKTKRQQLEEAQVRAAAWAATHNSKPVVEEEDVRMEDDTDSVTEQNEEEEEAPLPPVETPPKSSSKSKQNAQFEARARAAAWSKENKRTKLVSPKPNVVANPPKGIHPAVSPESEYEKETSKVNSLKGHQKSALFIRKEQNKPSRTYKVEGASDEFVLEEREEDRSTFKTLMKWFLKGLLGITVGLALLLMGSYLYFEYVSDIANVSLRFSNMSLILPHVNSGAGKVVAPPCFDDDEPTPDEATPNKTAPQWLMDKGIENCEGSPVPCPAYGVCAGGFVRSCWTNHFEVSDAGDQCIMTASSNETLAALEATLINLTTEDICSWNGCHLAIHMDTEAPMFPIENVSDALHKDTTAVLLLYLPAFASILHIKETKDGSVLVGLSDEFVRSRLHIDFGCWMSIMGKDILWFLWSGVFLKLVWISIAILSYAMQITTRYPLPSFGIFAFAWIFWKLQQRRKDKAQLLTDVASIRELAYGKLQAQAQEYVVLHLRDEVVLELYPTSKKQRLYIIQRVWPRVVSDAKQDNRVSKTCALFQGKSRDIWKWVAPKTKARRDASFE